MTLTDTTFRIPSITESERSGRLHSAGSAWAKRISANPSAAQLTAKATGIAEGSVATRVTAGRHSFVIDEPEGLAGDDAGPSPVEYALGALIGCQVVVYRLYAHALDIRVDDIAISAEGDLDARKLFGLDDSVRAGFNDVRLTVTLTGPETQERYEELREIVDARCPVHDLFSHATPVTTTVVKG